MRWYCKFCKLFTKVDVDLVCNNCQNSKQIFRYIDVDDDTEIEESTVVDKFSEN